MADNKLPRILAVDFDGTLVEDKYPRIGRPNKSIFQLCKYAKALDIRLILWTCRTGEYLDKAVAFCKLYDLEFDAVNDNVPEVIEVYGGNTRKVFADRYIDDKNISSYSVGFLWAMLDHEPENDLWR